MKKLNITLPGRLSAVIMLAVNDVRQLARNPNYKFDMGNWHRSITNRTGVTTCAVCLGGAILARHYNGGVRQNVMHDLTPEHLPEKIMKRVTAMDYVRTGHFKAAVSQFYPDSDDRKLRKIERLIHNGELPAFQAVRDGSINNPETRARFTRQLTAVAKKLASVGL